MTPSSPLQIPPSNTEGDPEVYMDLNGLVAYSAADVIVVLSWILGEIELVLSWLPSVGVVAPLS